MFPTLSRPSPIATDGLTKPLLKFRVAEAESPAVVLAMAVMAGCALYFGKPDEVGLMSALAGLSIVPAAFIALALIPSLRHRLPGRLGLIGLCILAGLLAGVIRSEMRVRAFQDSPVIDTSDRAVEMTGWLEAIERSGSGRRRLMIQLPGEGDGPAYRIRVLGDPGDVRPGDPVRVRVVLQPPREAVMPGGYDLAFQAYFRRLAATGYVVEPASLAAESLPSGWRDGAHRSLARLRHHLASRIRSHLPERSGSMAAALLTGDRSGMNGADMEALRTAGLGHLLAISGLHMALLAGGLFFGVRAVLAGLPSWARRHDPARPAAWIALIAAVLYLLLSGGAIPTQRAFIMTAAMLGAVLARRRALSFHTLALAVILVLMLTPEAVIAPGFQMSFAAVIALMVVAQAWQAHRPPPAPMDRRSGVRDFFGGMATTSLVAGLATGGYAAFHFHRMASFGLAGNLLVMPIFSLLVMPAGILALVLMPLGLEALPLWVMGWGLDRVLDLAHWVASWPGALQPLRGAPGWVLVLYTAGFLGLLVGRDAWRWAGGGLILAAGLAWASHTPPDLFVTRTGVVVAHSPDGADWAVSDRRRDRFATRVFLESQGVTDRPERLDQACDDWGCRVSLAPEGFTLIRLHNGEDWQTDCARADLILADQTLPAHSLRQCAARVLDRAVLEARGGALIWLRDEDPVRIRHVLPDVARHPWQDRPVRYLRD